MILSTKSGIKLTLCIKQGEDRFKIVLFTVSYPMVSGKSLFRVKKVS